MSLRDTISGAKEEFLTQRSASTTDDKNDEEQVKSGVARRSAAKAKPAREAASGVRVVSASGTSKRSSSRPLTKEEKKVERAERQRSQDRIVMASNAMLAHDPTYRSRRRIWWGLIIAGLVGTAASFIVMYGTPQDASEQLRTNMGIVAIVALVIAYGGIIGALIYEFLRIRPLRNAMDTKARGMSVKRLEAVIQEDVDERRAKGKGRRWGRRV